MTKKETTAEEKGFFTERHAVGIAGDSNRTKQHKEKRSCQRKESAFSEAELRSLSGCNGVKTVGTHDGHCCWSRLTNEKVK
jgi:hypothetical protein